MDNQIVIPTSFQSRILENLHSAHQGLNGMECMPEYNKQFIYWPGKNNCLQNYQTNMSNMYTDCTRPGQRTNWNVCNPWIIIVCIGLSAPSKTPPSFLPSPPPLKSANCPSPPLFRQSPTIYWIFVNSPSKTRIFPWIPKILVIHPSLHLIF